MSQHKKLKCNSVSPLQSVAFAIGRLGHGRLSSLVLVPRASGAGVSI